MGFLDRLLGTNKHYEQAVATMEAKKSLNFKKSYKGGSNYGYL